MKKGLDKNYIFQCLSGGLSIENAEFEYAGLIDFEKRAYKSIVFENCIFNDRVLFTNAENVIHFHFTNCKFNEVSNFEDIKVLSSIEFRGCNFKQVNISKCESIFLLIENCQFQIALYLDNNKVDNARITTEESNVKGIISIDTDEIENVEIVSSTEFSFGKIWLSNFNFVSINANLACLEIDAHTFTRLEVESYLENVHLIEKFQLSDLKFSGDIYVRNVKIGELAISQLSSHDGILKFSESQIVNTEIENCYVSNFILNQVKFIQPPFIQSSDLTSLTMNNVTWADKKKSLDDSFLKQWIFPFYRWIAPLVNDLFKFDQISISDLKYNIETYRQLKVASIANHNQIEALVFYRNEMRLYWKLVRIEGGIPWYDRLLVFVNRWSSDFGQNWFLPLLWMFVFGFILFSSLLSWNYFGNDWSGGKEFGQFWVLFNPVHKTPEYVNTGAGLFTEFFMRVVIGYFIYHFIKASRKFGKV